VGVGAAEQLGGDAVGLGVAPRVAVERVRLFDAVAVLGLQDPGIAHQPDRAARRERAAAEAEDVQLVAGDVVVDDEAVALLDVVREPNAQPAADEVLPSARPDARLVVKELEVAGVVGVGERERELRHVRRRRDALVDVIGAVPGSVAADDQALHR
jgi:hypothetical protein